MRSSLSNRQKKVKTESHPKSQIPQAASLASETALKWLRNLPGIGHAVSFQGLVRDFALVTYLVPASRLQNCLPEGLELETPVSSEGTKEGTKTLRPLALISTACFFNRNFRSTLLPVPTFNFQQIAYRTYVRYQGRIGTYTFRTDLGTIPSFALQRAICQNAAHSQIKVIAPQDPLTGYKNFKTTWVDSHNERSTFELTATLKNSPTRSLYLPKSDLTHFLTHRLHNFFRAPGGILMDQVLSHCSMKPWHGELGHAYFNFWEKLGVMSPQEMLHPVSVLVQPESEFLFYPPFPMHLLPDTLLPEFDSWSEKITRV